LISDISGRGKAVYVLFESGLSSVIVSVNFHSTYCVVLTYLDIKR